MSEGAQTDERRTAVLVGVLIVSTVMLQRIAVPFGSGQVPIVLPIGLVAVAWALRRELLVEDRFPQDQPGPGVTDGRDRAEHRTGDGGGGGREHSGKDSHILAYRDFRSSISLCKRLEEDP